jgi:hypothetical protein
MGISIAFTATPRAGSGVEPILAAASAYATELGWRQQRLGAALTLDPGQGCESITLSPGPGGLLTDNVKTQFAGPTVHTQVIGLLDRLQPLLGSLDVSDDSEFWEHRDPSSLDECFRSTAALIAEVRARQGGSSFLRPVVYWLRIVGICIGFFLGVVGFVLLLLWFKEHLGA